MVTNGLRVAPMENHAAGYPFNSAAASARFSFYGIGGLPDAWFDGVLRELGGIGGGNMYGYYLNRYNQREGILSDFTIQITVSHTGNNGNAHIVVNKVGSPTSTNMKLLVAITESHIPYNWYGLTEVNWVNRLMAPNASGTTLNFGSNTTLTFDIPFTVDASWVIGNLNVIAFIQDFTTKEVLNANVVPYLGVNIKEEVSNTFNLNIYPNPMNNTAMIAFDLKESSDAMVEVYDIVGKNVYSNKLGTVPAGVNTVDFDGSNLDAGMYIVKLTVNNQVVTEKITISK
jgi:hypothetical protein